MSSLILTDVSSTASVAGRTVLFGGCSILAVPSFRDRIPVIVDEVTTLTGPGEMIDVIVT
jgi:citrate lyase alpha subunit